MFHYFMIFLNLEDLFHRKGYVFRHLFSTMHAWYSCVATGKCSNYDLQWDIWIIIEKMFPDNNCSSTVAKACLDDILVAFPAGSDVTDQSNCGYIDSKLLLTYSAT